MDTTWLGKERLNERITWEMWNKIFVEFIAKIWGKFKGNRPRPFFFMPDKTRLQDDRDQFRAIAQ